MTVFKNFGFQLIAIAIATLIRVIRYLIRLKNNSPLYVGESLYQASHLFQP
jgi:hypothetical protein